MPSSLIERALMLPTQWLMASQELELADAIMMLHLGMT